MAAYFLPVLCLLAAISASYLLWRKTKRYQLLQSQLESEIAEKQQIISLVNHDIKAPFNRIAALEQLISLEKDNLTIPQQDYLDKIHQVVADGLSLIRNLVDYRNLEYRKVDIIPEQIELSKLTLNTVRRYQTLAEKKQLKFEIDIEPEVSIISDSTIVGRALDNIVSNAIKFSPNEKAITVSLQKNNSSAIIKVTDEALGFNQQDLKNLFQKFRKLSSRPTSGESTTGLGLFITKSLLTKVGGSIKCLTREGIGSTFVVELPEQLQD